MKRNFRVFLLVFGFFLAACAGEQRKEFIPEQEGPLNEPEKIPSMPEITDYRGKSAGEALPEWLEAYLSEGLPAVESLGSYAGNYAFVVENHGPRPLDQWLARVDIDRALPRVAARRVQFRFTRGLTASADEVYGRNYEDAIRAVYDLHYPAAFKDADYWIKDATEYRYFVLILVPIGLFESRIMSALNSVTQAKTTSDENSAYERLKDTFFEGF